MTKIYYQGVIRDMTSEEKQEHNAFQAEIESRQFAGELSSLRSKRNKLLLDCDWIELPNSPLTADKKIEWQTYRTNLRNLTNGLDTVEKILTVVIPTNPEDNL
tara:strand:+ start:204 stop:512 length:309 start_codon:yes stop_codon:yes gene_type:complete